MAIQIPVFINPSGSLLRRAGFTDKYSESVKLTFKRGVSYTIKVGFVDEDNLTGVEQPIGMEVEVLLKKKDAFDAATYLASGTTTVAGEATSVIDVDVVMTSTDLDDLMLADDADEGNDVASIDADFEIAWSDDAWLTKGATTNRILATIQNDVRR